jgi:hypothetical protein
MLRSASETAEASLYAKEVAAKKERNEREALAKIASVKVCFEQAQQEFEIAAYAVGRAGGLTVLFPGHEIGLEWFNGRGFVAKRLTRRTGFEEHLAGLCTSKLGELVRHCDLILARCPGLDKLAGDALLHRNSLVSLLETLWRRQAPNELGNVDFFLADAHNLGGTSLEDLGQIREQLGGVLERFSDLKRTESKYQTRRWENLTIPPGQDEATYVSWETSEDGAGLVDDFSAQKLKWLATRWPEIAGLLSDWIEGESAEGRFEFFSYVYFNGEKWQLDSGCEPDTSIDFCKPSLALAELAALGYKVELLELPETEVRTVGVLSQTKMRAPGNEHGCYRMWIRWG